MHTHVFGPNYQEKKSFVLIFNSTIYLFIFRYLFLYYKGILAFIFKHLFYVTNNFKTQEQIKSILGTTHV